jgi:hypothetical protein
MRRSFQGRIEDFGLVAAILLKYLLSWLLLLLLLGHLLSWLQGVTRFRS